MSETATGASAPLPAKNRAEDRLGTGAAKWWHYLKGKREKSEDGASGDAAGGTAGQRNEFPDRAAIARLKRASIAEAIADPALLGKDGLVWRLGFDRDVIGRRLTRIAVLAIVLAHVKDGSHTKLARVVGVPAGMKPDEAKLKPQRLRRLLAARGDDDILRAFRRVIALADGNANVANLARLVLDWDHDGGDASITRGERVRAQFLFDYYGAGEHAPYADASSVSDGADATSA